MVTRDDDETIRNEHSVYSFNNENEQEFDGLTEYAIVDAEMINYSEITSENDISLNAEQLSKLCASELVFFNNEI